MRFVTTNDGSKASQCSVTTHYTNSRYGISMVLHHFLFIFSISFHVYASLHEFDRLESKRQASHLMLSMHWSCYGPRSDIPRHFLIEYGCTFEIKTLTPKIKKKKKKKKKKKNAFFPSHGPLLRE